MPEILSYIVQGYVFIVAYRWISFKDDKDFTNLIVKSIAASYIIKIIFDGICDWLNIAFQTNRGYTLCLLIVSAISGLAVGKIITHGCFNDMLHELHIGRTTNDNIWKDAIKPYTWVRIFMKDGSSYLGQYTKGEAFEREPIILLSTYQKFDKDGDIVVDHSQDAKEFIMVNTKDFDRVEITHSSKEESLVDS